MPLPTLRAQWVIPLDRPPVPGGCITISSGRMVSVTPSPDGPIDEELPESIVFPAPLNAHTHLEFSGLDRPLGEPGIGFAHWLRRVIDWRQKQAAESESWRTDAVADGSLQLARHATAAVGEIASGPLQRGVYSRDRWAGVVFAERLGLEAGNVASSLAGLSSELSTPPAESDRWRLGISPHAPYSVRWSFLQQLVAMARRHAVPVAMHVAESLEELEFLATGSGPLRTLFEALDVWREDAFETPRTPIDFLRLLADAPRALVIHGNYLSDEALDVIAAHRATMHLVYCPRTHAFFQHAAYPLQAACRRSIRVSLGTDSRASNPDLNVAAEARFVAAEHPWLAASEVLRMITLHPAHALGLEGSLGSLAPGRRAALAAVDARVPPGADPYQVLIEHLDKLRPLPVPHDDGGG